MKIMAKDRHVNVHIVRGEVCIDRCRGTSELLFILAVCLKVPWV